MPKPAQFPRRRKLTLYVQPSQDDALEQLARELCCSPEHAALFALRVGLGLMPIARMPIGEHALALLPESFPLVEFREKAVSWPKKSRKSQQQLDWKSSSVESAPT